MKHLPVLILLLSTPFNTHAKGKGKGKAKIKLRTNPNQIEEV